MKIYETKHYACIAALYIMFSGNYGQEICPVDHAYKT